MVIAVGAWALACLGHPGITFGMTLMGAVWALGAWRSRIGNTYGWRIALVAAAGLGIAWLVYFREAGAVGASSLRSLTLEAQTMPRCFFALRWLNAGKLVQNAVLKFGCFVPLACLGWRRLAAAPALHALTRAWLWAFVLQALLALMTPVAFRFEYFVAPAVALAIGPIAAEWSVTRPRLLATAFLLSLTIQVVLGWLLLTGQFDIINVVIPSNRWPIMGESFPHLPGCDPGWPLAWW